MNGLRSLPFLAAGLLCAALAPGALAASTYYASPAGSGEECTQAKPCTVEKAVEEKALAGDSVVLEPGTYLLSGGLGIGAAIDLGGRAGAASTTLQTVAPNNVHVSAAAKSTLHDLTITGTGGLVVNSGKVERVFVNFTGPYSAGCTLAVATSLTDSVCWAHDGGSSNALDIAAPGAEGSVVLRNDTLISGKGEGINIKASSGGALKVDGANVIARGVHEADVYADFSGFSTVEASFGNSDYGSAEQFPPFTTVTAPGTNGNITAPPSFLDAASGNFAEASGSPTVDAGLAGPLIGATDLLGNPRSLPACIGGTPVPDIGAYELVPTVACAQPQPLAPSNLVKLGKLTKNRKKGTAALKVTVPGPGELSLGGKGVKKVARSPKGAATLNLPVAAIGSAREKLARLGSVKLTVTVRFTPTGGTTAQKTRSVKLVEPLR
jgi:hypothetical protein